MLALIVLQSSMISLREDIEDASEFSLYSSLSNRVTSYFYLSSFHYITLSVSANKPYRRCAFLSLIWFL